MTTKDDVVTLFKQADAICFDMDSTVCTGEGIDDLALHCGKLEKVKEITCKAMSGNMDFRESLELRLNIIKPNLTQVTAVAKEQISNITPNLEKLVNILHSVAKKVYIISGGFDCLIHPVSDYLGIPKQHVYANRLKFYYDGTYAGFDDEQPTSVSGGKGKAIKLIRDSYDHSTVLMIGDGITDMEACPPADAFIGKTKLIARVLIFTYKEVGV